jgi:hypothetical protein
LASFLALWDLYWEKIVVLQEAGGASYKCEVVLKLSRKTTVDLVAGRYDVIGFKRGNKPYKKFRDAGMIELKLSENIIQSELLDISADVEQPRPEKEAKEAKKRRKGTAHGAVVHNEEADESADEDDELMSLVDDLVSIVALGYDDYTSGVVSIVVSSTVDQVIMHLKKKETGGVFMEGPLIDLRSLPWESEARMRAARLSEQTICYSDAVQGEYNFISECTIAVAEVIDDLILALEQSHDSAVHKMPSIQRPMSSGVSISFVMETLLQAVENGSNALQSQAPRFRYEGPLIDLRSLPWETDLTTNFSKLSKIQSTLTEKSGVLEAHVQGERRQAETRDITSDCNAP